MSDEYTILATLSANLKAKKVLHTVVRGRAVQLRELIAEDVTRADALACVSILKNAQLIKETQAPIDDLKTYFVTATGLEMDQRVKI